MANMVAVRGALHGMAPVEGDHVVLTVHEVEACRLGTVDRYDAGAFVLDDRGARDDVYLGEHAV